MTARAAVAAALASLLCTATLAGCGPEPPGFQPIWTTSGTATTTEKPVPLAQYIQEQGIHAEPVSADSLPGLVVSMPTPAGWSKRDSPKQPVGTTVIAKGKGYPSAMLTVLKLTGRVNAQEVTDHVLADAELAQHFRKLDSSTDDFHGFPSVMIQGSQDLNGQRVQSWFRMVLAAGATAGVAPRPIDERYMVQLTIATLADQAAQEAPDVEKIIDGFTVEAK